MTLALAETLIYGSGLGCFLPHQYLKDEGITVDDQKEYDFIKNRLEKKTSTTVDGAESSGHESSSMSGEMFNAFQYNYVQFEETIKSITKNGICVPKEKDDIDFSKTHLFQFEVDPERGIDLIPDPMLLLIKAAVNWSWYCDQKLLAAYGHPTKEIKTKQQATTGDVGVPSTPIPVVVEFETKPVPVTP